MCVHTKIYLLNRIVDAAFEIDVCADDALVNVSLPLTSMSLDIRFGASLIVSIRNSL